MTRWKLEAMQTTATTWGVAVSGGGAVYLAASDVYLSSNAPGGSSLLSMFEALLASKVASTTVALDDTTGKITITWGAGTPSLVWQSTTLRDRLGFAGNLSAAASHTADHQAQGLWLPSNGPSDVRGELLGLGTYEDDRSTHIARSGVVWSAGYNRRLVQRYTWTEVSRKIWQSAETTTNESAESFYTDFLSSGAPIRVYDDSTDDNSYLTAASDAREYYETEATFEPRRLREGFDGLWQWTLELAWRPA